MFGNKKRRIPISAKDLKQAVVKKNKALVNRNKALESSIKDQEKELKSLEKERVSESKKLGKLLIEVEFQEDKFKKIKGGVYSNNKLLESKLEKVSKAESELCEYEDIVEKLEDRETNLKKDIESLEFYKAKCLESKSDLAGIQIKKDNALDKLAEVKSDISKAIIDGKKKVAYYEDQYDGLEEKAKKHEDMVHQFEQRLFETEDKLKAEENELKNFLAKDKVEKEKANNELQAIINLCNNSEDKYVEWEQKIIKAEAKTNKEEERYQKKVERGKKWDITFLEQVARKTLKKKIDNIDKAGLRDVLDG